MSDFIKLSSEMTKDAVQSLQQAKQYARSLENFVDALLPMIDNEDTTKALEEVRENAVKAGGVLQRIYNRTAREAFGVGASAGKASPDGEEKYNQPGPGSAATRGNNL
jgi:Glu-tRNA(Gln) amidotransferase subunit E-like FAD-binding protein